MSAPMLSLLTEYKQEMFLPEHKQLGMQSLRGLFGLVVSHDNLPSSAPKFLDHLAKARSIARKPGHEGLPCSTYSLVG